MTSVFPNYKDKNCAFQTWLWLLSAPSLVNHDFNSFFKLQLCAGRDMTCVLGRTCSRNISLCKLSTMYWVGLTMQPLSVLRRCGWLRTPGPTGCCLPACLSPAYAGRPAKCSPHPPPPHPIAIEEGHVLLVNIWAESTGRLPKVRLPSREPSLPSYSQLCNSSKNQWAIEL